MDDDIPKIGLDVAIAALHEELSRAIREVPPNDVLSFRYTSIELELQVELEKSAEGNAGVKFWVVEAGTKGSASRTNTNRIMVTIEPLNPEDGSSATVAGGRRPRRLGTG